MDFLSHATIVGFMGGAATVVSLQQLKGIFGLKHFTEATDIISVMRSVFSQTHQVSLVIASKTLLNMCLCLFIPYVNYSLILPNISFPMSVIILLIKLIIIVRHY